MKRSSLVVVLILLGGVQAVVGEMKPTELRCEYLVDPLAIDVARPRLSWVLESDQRGQQQTAYYVLVAGSRAKLDADKGDLWESGKIVSSQSTQVTYAGRRLASMQGCYWKVRVWDNAGRASAWSRPARWTMGLFRQTDWKARWITHPAPDRLTTDACQWVWFPGANPVDKAPVGTRYFRRSLMISQQRRVRRARFMMSADNAFTLSVNGKQAGKGDGWQIARTFDITESLVAGTNVLAVAATNSGTNPNPAGLTGKLLIEFDDGSPWTVLIDASWKASSKEPSGWHRADFDDSGWPAAKVLGNVGIKPWGKPKHGPDPLPIFRREFRVDKQIRRATVYVCGLGFYELLLNGRKVGDHVLDPGWTNYRKRCLYAAYDLTDQLKRGTNAIGVMLGNGMYNVTGGRYVKFTGSFGPPKLILQLHIDYTDGTSARIVSDGAWKTSSGPITFSCIYGGEDYDAGLERPGWDSSGFNDATWRHAAVVKGPGGVLAAQTAPPIKVQRTIRPVKVTEPSPGVLVYDLGQNFSGWPALEVRGPAGAKVKMIPAELLTDKGLANQRSSGSPNSFTYILNGKGVEAWRPRFTYCGFRYIQVEGAVRDSAKPDSAKAEPGKADPGKPEPAQAGPAKTKPGKPEPDKLDPGKPVLLGVEGRFVCSSARTVGSFECSNPLFNRIHEIINWAIRSNMQSVLTDCPHREKLGWLEEAHLMGPSVMYNYDVPSLYGKIFQDMSESQLDNGLVPDIAPEYTVFNGGFRDSPEWGSACVIAPWYVYQTYGDARVLNRHYEGMKRYVRYLVGKSKDYIVNHGLGDWCDLGPKSPGVAQLTPIAVTATATTYYDIVILRRVAELLGETKDAARHADLARKVRDAFNGKFFNAETNQYAGGSQTANAMALVLGLVEPDRAGSVLENIVKDVRAHGNHMTAGDVGHQYLLLALADSGRSDVVFDMTNQTEAPSYGNQIRHGATSLTEAWDGRRGMSQNHFMLGHVEEWFYRSVGGIRTAPDWPGYERIVIQPRVGGDLTWANCSYESIRGRIATHWRRESGTLTLNVTIPANTTGTVYMPARSVHEVKEGNAPAEDVRSVRFLRMEVDAAVFEVGSGTYRFTAPMK